MDFQNREGSKPGSGGVASFQDQEISRRERQRLLALEVIDLAKDPYFMKNHLGSYECKLCLTLHSNEGSYLSHTQGKKHQDNLKRRAARDQQQQQHGPSSSITTTTTTTQLKSFVKIGRPGFKIIKIKDPILNQLGLLIQIHYPQIAEGQKPLVRFMSAYEQRIETPDKNYQYLLVAAEPYETIAIKIQSSEIDKRQEDRFWTYFDADIKLYTIQLMFREG